jgi:hypothetical protein
VYEIAERFGPVARELLASWLELPHREGFVPDRESFDPMAITHILPVISLIEREGVDEWRFRLVGTEIERQWGRTFTGRNCFEELSPEAVAVMRRELRCIVEWPCGSWSRRRVERLSGRMITLETLRLPLRAKCGAVRQILSCNSELGGNSLPAADLTREIVRIDDQEYFDIGAGCPRCGAIL